MSDGLARVLTAGPWQAEPMALRVARALDRLIVTDAIRELITATLDRFPHPPPIEELAAFLARQHLPAPGANPTVRRWPVAELPDLHSLARLLDVDLGELDWFADVRGWSRRQPPPLLHYRWRTLPKRGGVRVLAAPKPRLKELQRRLLRHVFAAIPVHEAAHGGVPRRSVRTALEPHAGQTVVIRADIEGFFSAIRAGRVYALLRAAWLPRQVATTITGLCTTVAPLSVWREIPRPRDPALIDAHVRLGERLRTPHLPQGAPTSPALANAIAYRLDRRLAGLAEAFGARYTRYVDDLTFSGGPRLRAGRSGFVDAVREIVDDEGFRLAERKTVVLGDAGRQGVLGAVVNHRPTLPRRERDNLRALLHNCEVHGAASQARGRADFRAHVTGKVAAVAALDPVLGARLHDQLSRIEWRD